MKAYFAPKFGNLFMGAIDSHGTWGLWGCNVDDKEHARAMLEKRLRGKDIKRISATPFIETDSVVVFDGDADWDYRENVALTEDMVRAFAERQQYV